ncbi:hypothetical protein EJ03DRAFT_327205 [Teratosphaeria nubilosa]|uniref:Uncharacterized protein n=1 Tax=Teratosphaeria nubilosa TaxID=161662 RepID=A0A6G1L9P6_9PEZI|nr:hypothetical protein EJ03DRAFT_327205 [Teratosphaeria nubilosa]
MPLAIKMALTSPVASVYPSPPPLESDPPSDDENMGGYTANIDGIGILNIQRALDIARNTEGELDPSINQYLEIQLTGLWRRIQSHRDYILNKDEFALFNFYRARFADSPEAQAAVQRYWSNTYAEPRAQ